MGCDSALIPTYAPGTELMLVVDKAYGSFPKNIQVTIVEEITTTMSPVLEVTYTDDLGTAPKRAVLKLFDRRLGYELRKMDTMTYPPEMEYLPTTNEAEIAYRNFVRSGKASKLWDEIDADMDQMIKMGYPDEYYEPTEEGLMRFEGALQQMVQCYFRNEIAAYDKLAHMQGDCIPRMLAHVHLPLSPFSEMDDSAENNVEGNVENKAKDQIEDNTEEIMEEQIEQEANDEFNDFDSNTVFEVNGSSPSSSSSSSSAGSPTSSNATSPASSRTPSSTYNADDIESKMENKIEDNFEDNVEDNIIGKAKAEDNTEDMIEVNSEKNMDTVMGRLENNGKENFDIKLEDMIESKLNSQIENKMQNSLEEKIEDSPFLRVDGVLLEYVSGTPLPDFERYRSADTRKFKKLLQDAANTAAKINRAGLLMRDCRPGNVLVRPNTWQPIFVDFAQSFVGDFHDEEMEFGLSICQDNNPRDLVWDLAHPKDAKGNRGKVIDLDYPDLSDLRHPNLSGLRRPSLLDLRREDDSDSEEPTPPPSEPGT